MNVSLIDKILWGFLFFMIIFSFADSKGNPTVDDKVTFKEHVQPMFKRSCAICHADKSNTLPDITQYPPAYMLRDEISKRVHDEKSMPKHSPFLTESERSIVKRWVDLGAKEE